MNSVVEAVNSFLEDYNIKDKMLCLGFSGGYDSMCLLHVLNSLECKVVAVHLNHNWRGEESRAEAENCRLFCKSLGIQFYAETLPESCPHTETAARDARYDFFRRAMEKFGSEIFLTAHNADDNAETVIYRILKGTGIDGLCAILPKRDCFYRPLLKVRRFDIEKYCADNNLTPNCDSSNGNTKYKRNFIRHEIFPLFAEINSDFVNAINSLSELAKLDYESFKVDISTNEFLKLPKSLQGRILKNMLVQFNLDYDRKKISSLIRFVEQNAGSKSGKRCSLTSDFWFFVNEHVFEIVHSSEKLLHEVKIVQEGCFEFGDYEFLIKECSNLPDRFPKDSERVAYVNLKEIDFTLRTRRNGDIIRPLGCSGTQKLKKYFNEKKVSVFEKEDIPILCSENEVLWVPGYGISENIKVVAGNVTHMIKLTKKGG